MDDRDYDFMDDGSDGMNEYALRKIAYPPRLMVDFTSIGVHALQRYARFYNIKVDDECDKEDLAALVARHFDGSLEVEEHESISSFIQRVRNGERSSSKRSLDKDRRAAADKKRKKSNSRKRQRDVSVSVGAGGNPSSNSSGHGGHHGSSANGHGGSSSGSVNSGSHHHHAGSSASSSHHEKTTGSSSAGNATASGKGAGKRGSKKKDDNEDNELYCICNLPSYGNMIACDGKKCPNPSQWYHLECVGLADGRHPDTWLCPECDPKGFAAFQSKKKKSKHRSKSPGAK